MKLNQKGRELFDKWQNIYYTENDNLGGNWREGNLIEGWCIIDNYEYIKNIHDECGLLIYGYEEDALYHVEEWQEMENATDDTIYDKKLMFTYGELKAELKK